MGQHDYAALADGKHPTFARWPRPLADGGSVEYLGFGYSVTQIHRLTGHLVVGEVDQPGTTMFYVGQSLGYWIPYSSKESTLMIVKTNR